jgi:hypothetical protein
MTSGVSDAGETGNFSAPSRKVAILGEANPIFGEFSISWSRSSRENSFELGLEWVKSAPKSFVSRTLPVV